LNTVRRHSVARIGLAAALLVGLVVFAAARGQRYGVFFCGSCTLVYAVSGAIKALWLAMHRRTPPLSSACQPGAPLPTYTALVPLYHESSVLLALLRALNDIDYPADRLQGLLLVEPDDDETLSALGECDLAAPFEVIVVSDTAPRTKPKACNEGLAKATGEYVVVYDAEDRPEPDQLRKAVAAFASAPDDVGCFQARLNVYNARQNFLTRMFRLEYTLWFDVLLPALSRLNTVVPLGGTSNHFRTETLRELGGWDPYNVAEDCDLGVRIRRAGLRVGLLDSTTYEEAPCRLGIWVRQRSRWIKGYMQTFLVHTRRPVRLLRDLGPRRLWDFLMLVGVGPFLTLVNPAFWAMFWWYVVTKSPLVDGLFPGVIGVVGALNLVVGNTAFIYLHMFAAVPRKDYDLVKYGLLAPVTWGLMSVAAWMALFELFFRPHYWHKTEHGLAPEPANASTDERDGG